MADMIFKTSRSREPCRESLAIMSCLSTQTSQQRKGEPTEWLLSAGTCATAAGAANAAVISKQIMDQGSAWNRCSEADLSCTRRQPTAKDIQIKSAALRLGKSPNTA